MRNFDITQAFKANFTYELPIGAGHSFAFQSNSQHVGGRLEHRFDLYLADRFALFDLSAQGLLNRVSRSSRETAFTTETLAQLKNQSSAHVQPDGTVFIVNPLWLIGDGTGAADPGLTCAPTCHRRILQSSAWSGRQHSSELL